MEGRGGVASILRIAGVEGSPISSAGVTGSGRSGRSSASVGNAL